MSKHEKKLIEVRNLKKHFEIKGKSFFFFALTIYMSRKSKSTSANPNFCMLHQVIIEQVPAELRSLRRLSE